MGLGFVLLVWAAIAAAVGLIWLVSLGLLLFGWARQSRVLSWLGGVPLALSSCAGALLALLVACAVVYNGLLFVRECLR